MVAGAEEVNNRKDLKKLVVWSMDVCKLYPSLVAEQVAKMIAKAFLDCELDIEVDTDQLGFYLILVLGRQGLVQQGL